VSISPIETIDGGRLNEVRLDDVEVPVERRVGEENGAWPIVNEALAYERHVQFPPSRLRRDLEDITSWWRDSGIADDALVQRTLADLVVDVAEVEALSLVVLETMEQGRAAPAEAAANKLAGTELCQRMARVAMELGAPES